MKNFKQFLKEDANDGEYGLPDFGDDFGGDPKQSYDPHKDEVEEIINRTECTKTKNHRFLTK